MSCCKPAPSPLVKVVHDAYSAKARTGSDPSYSKKVAEAFGYTPEQLQSIVPDANMGLSCGNPVAAATIKEGEFVLDLGSGGGIDIFLAAAKVGPTGQAIGLDMSADMISLARRNAEKQNLRPPQVAFVQAALTEDLPIASNSIDCVLSNCVINLLPPSGKAHILKEVFRVLKPGGRVVLDDIIAKQPLPEAIRNDLASYVGCISGAIQVDEYKALLADAGLPDAVFVNTRSDLNVYYTSAADAPASWGCCAPLQATGNAPQGCCAPVSSGAPPQPESFSDANEWAAAYQIYAMKPPVTSIEASEPPAPLLRWWDAYPIADASTKTISVDEVAALIRDPTKQSFAVIDTRRNDHAGGHVLGSSQWAAQTFYDDLAPFVDKFGETEKVMFYCQSSNGRGPRCASWYQGRLNQLGKATSTAYVMQGGVKAWLEKFGEDNALVERD